MTARARIASPALGHDADRAAFLDDHLAHRRIDADLRAVRRGRLRHRLRDRPHAADGVAPHALLAVHLAEAMVQQHIGRARRVGARIVADDAVEAVRRLDRRTLEPVIEIVAGRIGEEVEQLALQVEPEMAQPVRDAPALDQLRDRRERMTFDDVRRRFQHERAQHVGDRLEPRLIGIEPVGIARGKLRDLLARAPAADLEIAPVIERQEIRDSALDDAQPVLGEPQIGDDLRVEQRDRVGGDRIAEAGMEFLRHRGAADDGDAAPARPPSARPSPDRRRRSGRCARLR